MSGLHTILSPAKSLQMDGGDEAAVSYDTSKTRFTAKTRRLAGELKDYTPKRLGSLMSISEKLAMLNAERWSNFGERANPRGAAAMCFRGDVYQGLEAWTMNKRSLEWAQDRVRILSGLYGLLRPLDVIQPYRLEMGTRLATDAGSNLYEFWGEDIIRALRKDMSESGSNALINLASDEYSKAARLKDMDIPVVDVKFMQKDDGKLRFISFHAKRARGLMARWMSDNRPKRISDLDDFDLEGYRFSKSESDERTLVFSRPKPAAKKTA
jgi:cytoplasmic iron level regulating protein YaaA (DUF328/UPF0246 family)